MISETHTTFKPSGIEWIGDIPSHWEVKLYKHLGRVVNGFPFDSQKFNPIEGFELIRIRDIFSKNTEVKYSGDWEPSAEVETGDVLVGMDGDFHINKWGGGQALLNQRVCKILPLKEKLDIDYLFYLLPIQLKVTNDLTYYTTVKHLSSNDILAFKIPLPPLSEQKAIATFLDQKTAQIDAFLEKKQALLELLAEERKALINQAVTQGITAGVALKPSGIDWIGDIPAHWEVKRLKYLASINPSFDDNVKDMFLDIMVTFIPMEAISEEGGKDYSRTKNFSEIGTFTPFQRGDLVIAKITPCYENGKHALLDDLPTEIGFGTTEFHVVRPIRGKTIGSYLRYILTSEIVQKEGEGSMSGAAGQKRVPPNFFENILIPSISTSEQKAIVDFLDQKTAQIDQTSARIRQEMDLLREYRQALITEAVLGRVAIV